MLYRIAAIGFIFACTSVAWIILAQVVSHRTHQQDTKLKAAVGQLWGTSQSQRAPLLYWTTEETVVTQTPDGQDDRALQRAATSPAPRSQPPTSRSTPRTPPQGPAVVLHLPSGS